MVESVSILIPCHNAEAWIDQAVQSALDQTWPHCEVIIIDDGSTDRSREILSRRTSAATVVLRENRGGNPTRNELLRMARGEWIQYLDADDYLFPDKVERQMESMGRQPAADMVYSPQVIEHHQGGKNWQQLWNPHAHEGPHDPWVYHLRWSLTQLGGALFRRRTLLDVGGWNNQQQRCQDNELYFRLLKHGAAFVRCEHAGSVYRRFEGGSVSTGKPDLLRQAILGLLEEGEAYLREQDQLTPARIQAANGMRFRLAKELWKSDRPAARRIVTRIKQSDPRFLPGPEEFVAPVYRQVFRFAGLDGAEQAAALARGLRRRRTVYGN